MRGSLGLGCGYEDEVWVYKDYEEVWSEGGMGYEGRFGAGDYEEEVKGEW